MQNVSDGITCLCEVHGNDALDLIKEYARTLRAKVEADLTGAEHNEASYRQRLIEASTNSQCSRVA